MNTVDIKCALQAGDLKIQRWSSLYKEWRDLDCANIVILSIDSLENKVKKVISEVIEYSMMFEETVFRLVHHDNKTKKITGLKVVSLLASSVIK